MDAAATGRTGRSSLDDESTALPAPRFPWRIAIASVLTITVGMLPGFLPGALSVQLADALDIQVAGVGLIVGGFFGVSALVSPVMGRLAERVGWPAAMRMAALGAGATLGLTPVLANSVASLGAITIVGGVALALAHPAVNLALARCTPSDRHGIAYGFKHAAIPGASALAGLALPLVAIPLGWEWVYGLTMLLAVLAVVITPSSAAAHEVVRTAADTAGDGRRHSSLASLTLLATGAGLGIFGMDALATFLVPYGVEVGFGEASAGVLLAIGSAVGIGMRLLAGWWIDRSPTPSLTTVAVFLAVGALGMVALVSGESAAVVIGSVVAFAFGWGWSGLFTYSVVHLNPDAPAAATGITMTGVYVGAAAGPAAFGVIADTASFAAAWVVMAVALGLGSVLMRLAGRTPEPG